jgi:hypothetical protein
MRASIVVAALVLYAGAAAADEAPVRWRFVQLNSPGAMEKLRASNPEHYRKIMSRIGIAEGGPHGLMEVSSRPFASSGGGLLLTTYPPQRNFEITLDNTTYQGRATVDMVGIRVMPLE